MVLHKTNSILRRTTFLSFYCFLVILTNAKKKSTNGIELSVKDKDNRIVNCTAWSFLDLLPWKEDKSVEECIESLLQSIGQNFLVSIGLKVKRDSNQNKVIYFNVQSLHKIQN